MDSKQVVFVVGSGHSGTTLMQFLISSHSRAFGLGEAEKIAKKVARRRDGPARICGICEGPCPFWDEQVPFDVLNRYFHSGSPLSGLTRMAAWRRGNFYRDVLDWSGRNVVVDSTKRLRWTARQAQRARKHGLSTAVVFMSRDGRAVLNSYRRKFPDTPVRKIIRMWKKRVHRSRRFFLSFAPDRRLRVGYEHMALDPESTTRRVCDLLGLDHEPDMLRYWEHEHHPLGGNTGTRWLIRKYQAEHAGQAPPLTGGRMRFHSSHGGYYEQHEFEIKLDLRWMQELSPADLALFERMAGEVNREFAYDG